MPPKLRRNMPTNGHVFVVHIRFYVGDMLLSAHTFRVAIQSSYYNPALPPPEVIVKFILNPDRINDMSAVRDFAAWHIGCFVCRHADRPQTFAERMLPGPTTTILDLRPPWVIHAYDATHRTVGSNWEPGEEPTRDVRQNMVEAYEAQEENARQIIEGPRGRQNDTETRPQRQRGSGSTRAEPEIVFTNPQ